LKILERADLRSMRDVRLVGEDGNDIVPIMTAWKRAEDQGLDLVLVSSADAKPPVVRIQDYKKLQYEKKKRQKGNRTKVETKEIQLKINISDHDLQTKVNNINKFISKGNKVKMVVRLKGRERDNPQRAHELLEKAFELVEVECKKTKLPGPVAIMLLEPAK